MTDRLGPPPPPLPRCRYCGEVSPNLNINNLVHAQGCLRPRQETISYGRLICRARGCVWAKNYSTQLKLQAESFKKALETYEEHVRTVHGIEVQ